MGDKAMEFYRMYKPTSCSLYCKRKEINNNLKDLKKFCYIYV